MSGTKFGYREMFGIGKPCDPDDALLNQLALCMSGLKSFPDKSRPMIVSPTVSSKASGTSIPAGYTYLSQFIDHDISFDRISDRFITEHRPWGHIDPACLVNLQTPNFNLEPLYGVPDKTGQFPHPRLMQGKSRMFLRLSDTYPEPLAPGNARNSYPNDVPRSAGSVEAEIADPRNDENVLIAQTHVAFIKFHNAIVLKLKHSKDSKKKFKSEQEIFTAARKLAIRHYQYIVLKDFLPKFIKESVLNQVQKDLVSNDLFYNPTPQDMFMPLEFSVAAFRAGHSMIRDIYELNLIEKQAQVSELTVFTGKGLMDNKPKRLTLPSNWIINWYSFYDIRGPAVNVAEPLNTEIASSLQILTPAVKDNPDGRASSLAALDLYRGRALRLPAGQDVAEMIAKRICTATVLSADQIKKLLLDKTILGVTPDESRRMMERIANAFAHETPLWFYILAEAEIQNKASGRACLGEVGSRIVAETIVRLLDTSDYSILREPLESGELFSEDGKPFGMAEMLTFVRDTNKQYFEELYPDRETYFDELDPLGEPA